MLEQACVIHFPWPHFVKAKKLTCDGYCVRIWGGSFTSSIGLQCLSLSLYFLRRPDSIFSTYQGILHKSIPSTAFLSHVEFRCTSGY